MQAIASEFLRLVGIMNELREKCPWDKKQTAETLRQLTIEETYELADAITDDNWAGIKEELGDLLLHIIFYSKIGSEKKAFTLQEVISGVCEKLILRHPHIYTPADGGEKLTVIDDDEVKQNWEKIKLKEGKKSVLGGVPKSLPSMVKAMRLQEKSKLVGFEWDNTTQVWEKVQEEIQELEEAVNSGSKDKMEDELGDVFFSLVNFARFLHVDAENALERTNKKFIRRFTGMEEAAAVENRFLHDMSLQEMDALWNKIKKQHI
ncbi:MAG: nucleoside triphosphate pyrophosphohydrolase [Ferruginibacter sp.]